MIVGLTGIWILGLIFLPTTSMLMRAFTYDARGGEAGQASVDLERAGQKIATLEFDIRAARPKWRKRQRRCAAPAVATPGVPPPAVVAPSAPGVPPAAVVAPSRTGCSPSRSCRAFSSWRTACGRRLPFALAAGTPPARTAAPARMLPFVLRRCLPRRRSWNPSLARCRSGPSSFRQRRGRKAAFRSAIS